MLTRIISSGITYVLITSNKGDALSYYVYENWVANGHKARVHQADCSFCQRGKGVHVQDGAQTGKWHGPFDEISEADEAAVATGGVTSHCKRCLDRPEPVEVRAPALRPERIEFHLGGRALALSREEVIRKLATVTPGPVRAHAVEIEGRTFPIKQAFAAATGTDPLDSNTAQARSVLQRLGFRTFRVGESRS